MSQTFPAAADTIEPGASGAALGSGTHPHLTAHGDIAFGINKIEALMLNDLWSTTSATFTVPAFGATVTATVVSAQPAVIGAQLYIDDGTRTVYGTITAVSGSTITFRNTGVAGSSSSGTMAIGAVVRFIDLPYGQFQATVISQDLVQFNNLSPFSVDGLIPTTNGLGGGGFVILADSADHVGCISLVSGTASGGTTELQWSQGNQPGRFVKWVSRYVVSFSALYNAGNTGQFHLGWSDLGIFTGQTNGVHFLFDPADSLTSLSTVTMNSGTTTKNPNKFNISVSQWYDLWISYTASSIKFYAAVFGTEPALVDTITTNIPATSASMLNGMSVWKGATGTTSQSIGVDLVEQVIVSNQGRRFWGQALLKA